MSSLSVNINKLIFYRFLCNYRGRIVLLANKFIFPYKLRDGIEQLINKILQYDEYLIEHSRAYLNKTKEAKLYKRFDNTYNIINTKAIP